MGYPVLIIASLTPFWPREKGSQNFLKLTYVVEALGPQHSNLLEFLGYPHSLQRQEDLKV